MSDKHYVGIFSICAGAYMLYVAKNDPGTATWFYRLTMEATGLNFALALIVDIGLIGVLIGLGLLLLLAPTKRDK